VGQELVVYELEPVRLPFTGAGHVSRQMFQCPVQNSIVTSAYGMRWEQILSSSSIVYHLLSSIINSDPLIII
jgi:hypothetical protein